MPDRAPTKSERLRWAKFTDQMDRCGRLIWANSARSMQLAQLLAAGSRFGISLLSMRKADEKKLLDSATEWKRIKKASGLVESYELGLQFFADGEISIVAPSNYTKEQIQALNLSGWFIPIAIGIVVIGGVVGRMLLVESENKRLADAYDTMIKASEARICADPSSSACKSWQVEKDSTDYASRKSLIEEITDGLSEVGATIKGGMGIGLALAVPLIAWMVLKK